MTDYELFGGKCPYTDKECCLTIECVDCSVDREEKESMARLDKVESEDNEDIPMEYFESGGI